jgi:rhodanese-related sulfurtransferase
MIFSLTVSTDAFRSHVVSAPNASITLNNSTSIAWPDVSGAQSFTVFAFTSREAAESGDISLAQRYYEGATSPFAIRTRFENRGENLASGTQYWFRVQAIAAGATSNSQLSHVVGAYVVPTRPAHLARQLMDANAGNYTLVDTRNPVIAEFLGGHLQGAILINSPNVATPPNAGAALAARAPYELPDKDALILLYCQGANRSAQAAHALANLGYTNVHDIGAWNTDLTTANGFIRVTPLTMPSVSLNGTELHWNEVGNAVSYTVFAVNRNLGLNATNLQTNNPLRGDIVGTITNATSPFDLNTFADHLEAGEYWFHVQAIAADGQVIRSNSLFSQEVIPFSIENGYTTSHEMDN